MPGLRFALWPIYAIEKFPWVQVPAGEIGVVVAQAGKPLPIGSKSARYRTAKTASCRRCSSRAVPAAHWKVWLPH